LLMDISPTRSRRAPRRRWAARTGALRGTFFEPTVLTDVTTDMVITKEETFSPVAPLYWFKTDDETVRMAPAGWKVTDGCEPDAPRKSAGPVGPFRGSEANGRGCPRRETSGPTGSGTAPGAGGRRSTPPRPLRF
jgi:hypothetical protein